MDEYFAKELIAARGSEIVGLLRLSKSTAPTFLTKSLLVGKTRFRNSWCIPEIRLAFQVCQKFSGGFKNLRCI